MVLSAVGARLWESSRIIFALSALCRNMGSRFWGDAPGYYIVAPFGAKDRTVPTTLFHGNGSATLMRGKSTTCRRQPLFFVRVFDPLRSKTVRNSEHVGKS